MSKPTALAAASIPAKTGSSYPGEFKETTQGRAKRALGDVFGLTQFGVNLTEIAAGAATALRHWHSHEDEFVYVLSGTLTLITDAGEEQLTAGMCAGFPAGVANGHCLVNRSDEAATIIEVGSRDMRDEGNYPDDDLQLLAGRYEGTRFTRKDGTEIT